MPDGSSRFSIGKDKIFHYMGCSTFSNFTVLPEIAVAKVTTLARSVAPIEHNLQKYGLASRCSGARASDVTVLELEEPGSKSRENIENEIERAVRVVRLGLQTSKINTYGAPLVKQYSGGFAPYSPH